MKNCIILCIMNYMNNQVVMYIIILYILSNIVYLVTFVCIRECNALLNT